MGGYCETGGRTRRLSVKKTRFPRVSAMPLALTNGGLAPIVKQA